MRNFKKIALLGLSFSLFFYGCNENNSYNPNLIKETKKIEINEKIKTHNHPRIYNRLTEEFIKKEKGISEDVINKNIKYLDKKDVWIYHLVDSTESNSKFACENKMTGLLSGLEINMFHNFCTVHEVDSLSLKDLKPEYISLKNLLNELNLIYEKDSSHSYKSLKEMYFLIGKNIIPNEEITDLPIQEIISGKGGVCRDIVSTYYPLLDYYGFDAGFKFGISNKILHTWLSMNLNGDYFELDPSWYSNYMIPLEKRLKEDN